MSDMPTIGCLCVTYKRPEALARMIGCFEAQTYPHRELMVLDDSGQYEQQSGDRWRIASVPFRFATLGEKRNACAGLLPPEASLVSVWDDDDLYLPWHLESLVEALSDAEWAAPREVLVRRRTGGAKRKASGGLFHAAGGFTRELFRRVGGYPAAQSGEDQGLGSRFHRAGVQPKLIGPVRAPSYAYSWFADPGAFHLSALGEGDGPYRALVDRPAPYVGRVTPILFDAAAFGPPDDAAGQT